MKKFFYLILFLSILAAIFGGYFGSIVLMRNFRADNAEKMGVIFVNKVYAEYTILGQNCQGEDTDQDSYVSCAFRLKNLENTEKTVRLECPTVWKSYTGSSCKESLSFQN